jgi:DNA polymerase III alpha subunit
MIHLRLRSEYSFRAAYGKLPQVMAMLGQPSAAALTDGGTWGHVAWMKLCKANKVKPLFGVELMVVDDARARNAKKQKVKSPGVPFVFIARNNMGLEELYHLVSRANTELNYYVPRLDYTDVAGLSTNVFAIATAGARVERLSSATNVLLGLEPGADAWNRACVAQRRNAVVVLGDNLYPTPTDRDAYEVLAGQNRRTRTTPAHILDEWELRLAIPEATDEHFACNEWLAAQCDAILPTAEMAHQSPEHDLRTQCLMGAEKRGILVNDHGDGLADPVYNARLDRELEMIYQKKFQDYFYLVGDMVREAKKEMLVGPARGSSAGSLVCFLLEITDVDPILHDLMFERFIDLTRADLPDIDIDFPDTQRDRVIEQLRQKYGAARVGRIGTVMRYKAKSTLGDVAKELGIPPWEMKDVKEAVIERSTGDARAQFCVKDALETLDIGKQLIAKYPSLIIAGDLEGHARSSGTHAAGVIVSEYPISQYCSTGTDGASQIDKKDAEILNMLKMDILGLRTLSVIQDCLDQIGKPREWLVTYPLDDVEAFEVFNAERYSGIFQFEGYALQSLTRQMKIKEFNDIVVITALARPGPLHCGAATEFIARRIGNEPVTYLHDRAVPLTADTYGTVIYQEQVMAMGRAVGELSWEDVSELRKAMSKSLGEEFFNKYWVKFEAGAATHNIPSRDARAIWDKMCTFGSWAFNKSHAVSYGLVSYWCAMLKAHWPLEYAAACLRNAKDQDQSIKILRELVKEGYAFKPVDARRSGLTWQVVDGVLVGGLTNIKGIGLSKAKTILADRKAGKPMTPGIRKLLGEPLTPFDDIFEGERRFADIYAHPEKYNILSGGITRVKDINEPGEYVFIAKLVEKNLRDMNEYGNLVKRGGRVIGRNAIFLNMVLEDDTGPIIAKIPRFEYPKWGKPIVESGREGDWYIWKGRITQDGWRLLMIDKWRRIQDDPKFPK